MKFNLMIPAAAAGLTLDTYLTTILLLPKKTKHFLRMAQAVFINQHPALFQTLLQGGEQLTLDFNEIPAIQKPLVQTKGALTILFEDEQLIILNKPAGVKTHPNTPEQTDTLLNQLAYYLKDAPYLPAVVHRLDEATSGAILFAKNPFILPILDRLLAEKKIKRVYQARVVGHLKQKQGDLTFALGRDRHNRQKQVVVTHGGKAALTHYQVLRSFANDDLVQLRLATGRTHQIRVHLAAIGHPILGDQLYGTAANSRLLLHATQLTLTHPLSGLEISVTATLPPIFTTP